MFEKGDWLLKRWFEKVVYVSGWVLTVFWLLCILVGLIQGILEA